MNALEEVEKLLPHLTPSEKAQVLLWAARDSGGAFAGVETTSGIGVE